MDTSFDPKRVLLESWLQEHNVPYEYFAYEESTHSVEDTVRATGIEADAIIKSMIFRDPDNRLIRAIVLASHRVSSKRLAKALDVPEVTFMEVDEVLERTQYPPGGMPCVGYDAITVIDPLALEREKVYTGGGTTQSLLLIATEDIVKINQPQIARIRK